MYPHFGYNRTANRVDQQNCQWSQCECDASNEQHPIIPFGDELTFSIRLDESSGSIGHFICELKICINKQIN